MKPHLLRMEAFGPYAEPTSIDFDALSDEGLFLIHGSTGAGKTFLLDALCFALYGEVSGERSPRGLKSDHAAPAAVPRVSLEFSCGGARYRVERSPAYTAPKARGQGTTEKPTQAVLFRLNGSTAEPIASRTVEVSREVEQLVGLNGPQFRQVILLPQGRFAEVLRARADEREALLKTLFDSVIFERAGLWLEDQARTARQGLAERNRQLETLRQQAAQVWSPFAPALPAGEASPPIPTDQAELDRLLAAIDAVVEASAGQLQQCSDALQAAQAQRTAVERLADRWDRRAAALSKRADLEGKQTVVAEYRQRLQQAERAEALRPSIEAAAAAQDELNSLQQRIDTELRRAARAREAVLHRPDALQELELRQLPGLETLALAGNALAALRVELTALIGKAREAAAARGSAQQAAQAAAAAAKRLNDTTARLGERQQQRELAAATLAQATSARDQLAGLRQAARAALERLEAIEAIAAGEAKRAEAIRRCNGADALVNQRQAELLELRQRQLAGMAARLAGDLSPEAPCPVCGSTEHPAPAQPSADAVADAAIQAAEQTLSAATGAARQAGEAVAAAEAELRALRERAGEAADDPEAARAAAKQAEAALQTAATRAAELEALQGAIDDHERQLKQLEEQIQAARTDEALQSQAGREASQRAQALQTEIEAALGPGLEPQAVLSTLPDLEQALRELAGLAEASAGACGRLEQATARLQRELAGTEFADAEAVRAALKEESWRLEVKRRIENVDNELIEVRGLLSSPDLADLPENRPDTATAEAAATAADASRTTALERHSQARSARSELARLAQKHRQEAAEQATALEQAQRLSAVADRCTGRAAPYVSLQRWVLSAYLAEICRHANQRLELMTSGRYQLRLSDEGGRGGRQAGLGLRVLDAYTGEEREVSSLSGGETFQASLALALGVADTVQAHAGGLHLEALFIDEGFGTLDPDNLQLAMDELDRLREGGRMIGVISHVAALRERIRAGIAISSGSNGSRASLSRTGLT